MSDAVYSQAVSPRQQEWEKAGLDALISSRMKNYQEMVRELRERGKTMDSSAFRNSLRKLESEVTSLKNLYDLELSSLRKHLGIPSVVTTDDTSQFICGLPYTTGTYISTVLYPPAPMTREQERAELVDLNIRMQQYLAMVRKIQEEATTVTTSSALVTSVKMLEEEVVSIKSLYDAELSSLRVQLEEITAQKNSAEMSAEKNIKVISDLEERLTKELHRYRLLEIEIENLMRICGQKDVDFQQAKVKIEEMIRRIRILEEDVSSWRLKYEETQRRLETEIIARQEAHDAKISLQQKLEFQEQLHKEQTSEWKMRMESETAQIVQLETKVRELSGSDGSLQELIEGIRAAAALELQKYKESSEAIYHKNIHELKIKIEADATIIEQLNAEIKKLEVRISEFKREVNTLEFKLSSAEHSSTSVRETMSAERERTAAYVRTLEEKVRKLEISLVEKMEEITRVTEAKLPLRLELEALKATLASEEKRLTEIFGSSFRTSRSLVLPTCYYGDTKSTAVRFQSSTNQDSLDSVLGRDVSCRKLIGPIVRSKTDPPSLRPIVQDQATTSEGSIGSLKIQEISEDGRFIRLLNTLSTGASMDIGGYSLQQNVGGHPVALFRFPPGTRIKTGSVVTVWAASSLAQHNPPTDFLWRDQDKWGTGPECLTMICKPGGEAIAWSSASHRFTKSRKDKFSYSAKDGTITNGRNNPPRRRLRVRAGGNKEIRVQPRGIPDDLRDFGRAINPDVIHSGI